MRITTKGVATGTAAALAFSLAACGSDDGGAGTGGDTDAATGDGEQASIVWDMWAGSQDDIDFLDSTAEIVRAENPNVDLELQTAPWNDYFTKLTTNLSSGNVACVTSMNGQRLSTYSEAFLPLGEEELAKAGVSAEDFTDGALDIMTYDGVLYGLPFDIATMLVYYNKDLLAAGGADEPELGWTFDDFEAIAQAATTDDNRGFAVGMGEFQWMALPIARSGVQPVNEAGELALTDPAFVDASTWYAELVTEQGVAAEVPSASDTGWGENEYSSGNAAMAVDGTWNAVSYLGNEAGFEAGMTNLPEGDHGSTALILGSGYGISKDCDDVDAALAVLGSLVGKDAQDVMAETGRSYPARAESQPLYFESLDDSVRDEVEATFEAAFADVEGQRSTTTWEQVNTAIQPQLVSVYSGQASMADVLAQVQQQFGN